MVISLAEAQECRRLINRTGNVTSAEGAPEEVEEVIPLLRSRFHRIFLRGDNAFACQALNDACENNGLHFAFVAPAHPNFHALRTPSLSASGRNLLRRGRARIPRRERRRWGKNARCQKPGRRANAGHEARDAVGGRDPLLAISKRPAFLADRPEAAH